MSAGEAEDTRAAFRSYTRVHAYLNKKYNEQNLFLHERFDSFSCPENYGEAPDDKSEVEEEDEEEDDLRHSGPYGLPAGFPAEVAEALYNGGVHGEYFSAYSGHPAGVPTGLPAGMAAGQTGAEMIAALADVINRGEGLTAADLLAMMQPPEYACAMNYAYDADGYADGLYEYGGNHYAYGQHGFDDPYDWDNDDL
jgi:hypothetical protein